MDKESNCFYESHINMIADIAVIDAIKLLDNNPDYKIIRRITSRKSFAESDGRALLKGV